MSVFHGKTVTLSIYGASHAEAIGMELKGIPAGLPVNMAALGLFLSRRAPSPAVGSTARKEPDEPVFESGVENGITTGDAVRALIYNRDARSRDYEALRNTPRPGHADYTARMKYGPGVDLRGGGVFSGRMTAPLCIAGGLAMQWLETQGIVIGSHIAAIGGIADRQLDPVAVTAGELNALKKQSFATLSAEAGAAMMAAIEKARDERDSLGGIIECAAVGVPVGWGGELFDGVESTLARLVFSVPAVKGFELGAGFAAASLSGSGNNDAFCWENGAVKTLTNRHGGLLGGITSGMPLVFRAAVKPTPSIGKKQQTVDLSAGRNTELEIGGRHDACIVPRALPVMEACMALALLDEMMYETERKQRI